MDDGWKVHALEQREREREREREIGESDIIPTAIFDLFGISHEQCQREVSLPCSAKQRRMEMARKISHRAHT